MYSSAPPGGPARRGGNPPVNVPPPQIRGAPQSNMTGGPGMGATTAASSRIGEMLDQVKGEYEAIMQQHSMTKMEQIEMERKLQAQVVEMDQMQQTLKTLEANHRRIRQQYEEDMMRMRRQLEGQQAAGVKLPPKRHRTPTNASQSEGDPLMSVVAAAAASNRASGGRSNSPVRVMPVQPASRSLQQLGQPQSSGSSQLSPLENQATTPTNRRVAIPSLNSRNGDQENQNGKGERLLPPPNGPSGPSSPMSKKAKTEGNSIPSLSNTKGTLPSVSAATSNASGSSSLLPSSSKSRDDRQGSGGDLSPTGSNNTSQSQQMASSTPTPSNTSTSSKQGTPTSANQSGTSGSSTAGSSNPPSKSSKSGKATWNAVYSNSSSALPDSDRPVASILHEMNHQSVVCCVRFSADGTMMATGCHKTARVFDVKTSERKFIVSRPGSASNGNATNESDDAYVRAVCFSPDNTKLVAGMPQNTIRTWDIATNEEGPAMVGHELEIYSLDYVNDIIVSGSGDRKVRLWDARTGQCKKVFGSDSGGPSDGVTSVALSPDGRLIAAASLDKVVRIWDAETSQLMDRYEGHSDSVYSIAFSPDGKNVISGSLDKNIMLWDVNGQGRASSRPRMVFQGHKDFVLSVAYTPDGMLMSGSKDRSVVFWEPRSASPVLTLTGYRNSVISVAASPSTPYVGTGSGDCLAAIWNYQCQSF